MKREISEFRCCDNHLETPIICKCEYFWWDTGPLDETGDTTTDWYKTYICNNTGLILKPCNIKHTQIYGCNSFKQVENETCNVI